MKKFLSLIMLLVAIVTGAKADVTVGLTQDYTSSTGAKTWTDATNITLTQQIGSNTLNYDYGDKDDVYLDGAKIADKGKNNYQGCWRAANASYTNSYLGYDLAIGSGYILNITSFYARVLSISNATLTWKFQILSNTDAVLYESAEQTLTRASNPTPSVSISVSSLSEADQAKLQALSGTVKVRLWVKCASGQTTKYYGVDNLTITGSVVEDTRPTYSVTASVAEGQEAMGSVAGGGDIAEGETAILTATANTGNGYAFVNWTLNDVEASTDATLVITNVSADAAYVANFKQVYQVAWHGDYRGTYGKAGTGYSLDNGVNEKWADKDNKFIIPSYMHKYYYRPGYRFKEWQIVGDESTNRYNSGDEITVTDGTISSNKVTVKPVFTATTATLNNSQAPTTVTWSLAKSDMVFVDWQSSNKYEYYTVSATVNGKEIAVPMKISKGKVANYTRTDDLAQTNQNTEFTIPAVKGMVVTIANAYTAFTATTIAGSTEYEKSDNDKTITYTYNGNEAEIAIVIGETNQFLRTIQVVYPAATETIKTNAGKWASYTPSFNVTLEEGAVAYYITNISDGGQLDGEAVTTLKAGTGYFVKGAEASHTYTATYSDAAADATDGNMLVGCTESTTLDAGYTPYRYFLGTDSNTGNAGLFYVGSTAITIPAGKCYLQTEANSPLSLTLPFEEVTAISNVDANANVNSAAPVKIIKNGKLYIGNYNVAGQLVK